MGCPKEGVRLPDGRKMIEHVIAPLSQLCSKIVIVGDCRGFSIPQQSNFIALPDHPNGKGPLAAIATLLKSGIDAVGYIVTACDQPFVTLDILRLLVGEKSNRPTIFQSDNNAFPMPLPGYYPVGWLSTIERELASSQYGLCNAILKSDVVYVSLPNAGKQYLQNINTPADLCF
jgi:molybdopterin-guanine dinucleotide biosynthesis protein A